MKKKVLVAIDFSPCSLNALEHALVIADKAKADLRMVWVESPNVYKKYVNTDYRSKILDANVNKLEELCFKYKVALTDSVIDYKIRKGKVYQEIVKEADEIDAWLVVTGTHGSSGFEEFWVGSNANKVVTSITRPIITIRDSNKETVRVLKKIVLPIDDTMETRQKVPFAVELASVFKAKIYLLKIFRSKVESIVERTNQYAHQVEVYLDSHQIDYKETDIHSEQIATATLKYADEIDASLIVTMTEQEAGTMSFLLGPSAAKLVHHSRIPVLSIHPKEFIKILSRL
ncbi:MAG: universal stress protein [Hyphomicrobiales bacterium]